MFSDVVYRFQRLIGRLGTDKTGTPLVTIRQVTSTFNQVTGTAVQTIVDTVIPGVIGAYQGDFERHEDVVETLVSVLIDGEGNVDSNGAPLIPKPGDQVLVNGVWLRVIEIVPGFTGPRVPSYELVCNI